ncbi:hypothetical protein FE810_09790 [Thalassotalea litorea]|uniref:Uncharacterized protein n=1 Tax=Thalassotalea litorea TaxID=2020715 RepID=A0A5R9IKT6_9GAMM|nr:hypothetical protein [Thalassotalea litorea]TLU65199.1 hypothetical protein FE810_09790 [Thalassotalea litorea]
MKLKQLLTCIVTCAMLWGCGHGYEGEYQIKSASNNEFVNAFADAIQVPNIIIGEDFIEKEGKRTYYDEVSVRERGGDKYLVFRIGKEEQVWKIVNENTLQQGKGLLGITLNKIMASNQQSQES